MDETEMDYSNPYDYANPISNISSFADRNEEILDIIEYLELTEANNPTYFNLAITGPRASGKTSLLNILQKIVDEKGFLPIKVDLNNHLVDSDAEFFKEILDGIIEEGVRRGMYDGQSGKVYRKYKELINTLDFEVTFDIPFNFGGAYIGSKKESGVDRIKQRDIKEDLEELYNEAQKMILGP